MLTVIMPARNAEEYIEQAIASVLAQTYTEWEMWVLENGSTDGTVDVVHGFSDRRIKLFELGPVGFRGALEFGIRNSTSPWLARMDADDIMLPLRLERQCEVINNMPRISLVGTHHSIITPSGHVFETTSKPRTGGVSAYDLATHRGFADPSVVFNRHLAVEVGGTDPEFGVGSDIALWFRLLQKRDGWQIGEPLYGYRLLPTSLSQNVVSAEECLRVREKYIHGYLRRASLPRKSLFWTRIASFELMAGDLEAVRYAASKLEHEGNVREAALMRWRARFGRLAAVYYRHRNRNRYRFLGHLENQAHTGKCSSVSREP